VSPTSWDLILRLLVSTVLAATFGAEREVSDQPAGFRTHALVGLGAALFTIVSAYGFGPLLGTEAEPGTRVDLSRVASQVVVGIGFLGGGAIVKYGASIRGLTTAATLWATAAVGMAIGLGAFAIGVTSTLIGLGILAALRPVRRILQRHSRAAGTLDVRLGPGGDLGSVITKVHELGASIRQVILDDDEPEGPAAALRLRLPSKLEGSQLVTSVADLPPVRSAEWSD
jgi:putative Mg2+ transporter-C (MgtC) family protein